jgi:lipoprotein-anchoring transpeptidase ErfK/SrfK
MEKRLGALLLGTLLSCGSPDQTNHAVVMAQERVSNAVQETTGMQEESVQEHPALCLRGDMQQYVKTKEISCEDESRYHADIVRQLVEHGKVIDFDQLVVYVDRNPQKQILMVALVEAKTWKVSTIGCDHVSTGTKGRKGYFITPTGVFQQEAIGWRAEGTKNKKGVRGLGKKGMRIWDLGWVDGQPGWLKKEEQRDMRLQIHATDPDLLEKKLGAPASKGCIRVSAGMNQFLDLYSVLDFQFESHANDENLKWLLRKNRVVHPWEGQYVVVGDSSLSKGI